MRVTLAIALGLIATAAQPAMAWEHGFDQSAGGLTHWTTEADIGNRARLSFYCTSSMPGSVHAQLNTGEPGGGGGTLVEFSIEVGNASFGPLAGRINESEGRLIVYSAGPQGATAEAARAAYASAGAVTVTYQDNAWTFRGANYADSFGAMLDGCG